MEDILISRRPIITYMYLSKTTGFVDLCAKHSVGRWVNIM